MAEGAVTHVRGLKELTRTFKNAPKDVNRAYRAELRSIGEPTRAEAQSLAASRIRRMTVPWSKMRVGVSFSLVYVVPRLRGVGQTGRRARRRPNLADLLMDRAMEPALEHNRAGIEREFEDMLDRLVNKWDADGP